MIKKLFSSLLAALLVITIQINCTADTKYETTEIPVPHSLLFLGDSIATGYGLEGYQNGKENCNSYANQLTRQYTKELDKACDVTQKNLAIDGQTSGELLKSLQNGKYDTYLKSADAIVVSIGGNDMLSVILDVLRKFQNTDSQSIDLYEIIQSITSLDSTLENNLTAFDKNISEISHYINEKSNAVIVLQTLYNPFDQMKGLTQFTDFAKEKIDKLNESIIKHKDDENGKYLIADVATVFNGKGDTLTRINSFDIHPTQEGHNIIAQCVDKVLRTQKYSYEKAIEVQTPKTEKPFFTKKNVIILALIFIFTTLTTALIFIVVNKQKGVRNKK